RAQPGSRRPDARRPRPRRLHRQGVGVARGKRPHHRTPDAPPRHLGRLVAQHVHDGPHVCRGGHRILRAPARRRPHLSWPAPGQLGSGAEDRDLRSRSRQRRRRRPPVVDLLPARRWQRRAHRRHDAPGNDARRHRRHGASGRRALRAPDRQAGEVAADRSRDPGDRRCVRGSRIRHRCGQGHARARLQRLPRRPAPRPAADQHLHTGGGDQRQRAGAVPRPRPLHRAQAGAGRSRSAGPAGGDQAAQAAGAARRPHGPGDRAVPYGPVVREDGRPGQARHGTRREGRGEVRPAELGEHLSPLDGEHPGLVHQPPALVGPSHPGVVRRERKDLRRPQRRRRAPQARPACGRRAAAGQRRAGDLVLLATVADRDDGLAARTRDGRPRLRALRAVLGAGHRLRHHLLLGRAHDHGDRPPRRPGAVPRRLHHGPGPRQGQVPFRDVYITGLVRDKDGQKMSKSKGNILDPLDIIDGIELEALVAKRTTGLMKPETAPKIEKATRKEFPDGIAAHGADPLRFTMASLAGPGRDIKFDMGRAEGYKNFCNKLWNATRFVLMNTEGKVFSGKPAPRTDAEQWILARLEHTTQQAAAHFAAYRFDLLAQALYEFAWNEFCDWFVELAKPALNGSDAAAADSTRHTLLHVLESLLRLLHPLMPFVTEELWQSVAPRLSIDAKTISLQAYPEAGDNAGDFAAAEADVEWLKAMVSGLRRIRSELGVSPTRQITLLVQGGGEAECKRMGRFDSQLRFLNRIEKIDVLHGEPPAAAAGLVGEMKLFVPLEGLVDLGAERTRLDKELKRVEGELAKSKNKLASDTFVQNAPPAVVEQERTRLAEWTAQRD